MTSMGMAHVASALAALALGALVLLERKGTQTHRALGAGYVLAMLMVNLTSLAIFQLTGRFGPFHALALVNLATIAWGVRAALVQGKGALQTHAYCMAWSYVGLLAAAGAEVVVRVPAASINTAGRGIAAGMAIAALFLLLGMAVLPRLLRRALATAEKMPSPRTGA